MTEETAAKEAPETTTKEALLALPADSPEEAAQAALEAQAVGAIEGPTEQPQADGERPEPAVAAEPGEPSAQTNGDIAALKDQLGALKNAVDARATTSEIQELRSSLDEMQRSLAVREDVERPAEGEVAVEPQPNGAQERVDALGRRVEELSRTVRATVLPERIDPTAIPPPVLQEVYEKTLTDVYQEMARQFGAGAPRTTRAIMEEVRRASSGMEFFRLVDDRRIEAPGLAQALRRKLLSPHQVHLTYNEFIRRLSAQVPLFRPQSFADLVSARTSAYTVATVASQVEQSEDVKQAQADISTRLDELEAQARQVTATGDDRIEQQVKESISKKLAKLEAQAGQPEDVRREQAATSKRLDELEAQAEQSEDMNQAQAAILQKIVELDEEEVRQVIGAGNEQMERGVQKSVSKRLDGLEAQAGEAKDVRREQAATSKRLDGIEAEIRKLGTNADERRKRVDQKGISKRLDKLEADIRKSVASADERMKGGVQKSISKRLDKLEAQIQQVVATVDKLNSINF